MARSAAQLVLGNMDLVHIILGYLQLTGYWKLPEDKQALATVVRVNKAFYAAGNPLLYRSIELSRSFPPQPSTSYAIRLRCLQDNSSLGHHVLKLEAVSVTVEQLDKFLTYLPRLEHLRWKPLALQRGTLKHLPNLPETVNTLEVMRPSPADAIYRYDSEALRRMVSPLRNVRTLIARDFNLQEVVTILEVIGRNLNTLVIDRTFDPMARPDDDQWWPPIFKSVPGVRALVILDLVPASAVGQLPSSVERMALQGLEIDTVLEVVRRMKDPAWLPNLKFLPALNAFEWTPESAELYGYDYLRALPSKAEVLALAKAATAAFCARPQVQESGSAERLASGFCTLVVTAVEEILAWRWHLVGDAGSVESETSEQAWEE